MCTSDQYMCTKAPAVVPQMSAAAGYHLRVRLRSQLTRNRVYPDPHALAAAIVNCSPTWPWAGSPGGAHALRLRRATSRSSAAPRAPSPAPPCTWPCCSRPGCDGSPRRSQRCTNKVKMTMSGGHDGRGWRCWEQIKRDTTHALATTARRRRRRTDGNPFNAPLVQLFKHRLHGVAEWAPPIEGTALGGRAAVSGIRWR